MWIRRSEAVEYNSHNTERLDVPGMQALLMKLCFMQGIVRGEHVGTGGVRQRQIPS